MQYNPKNDSPKGVKDLLTTGNDISCSPGLVYIYLRALNFELQLFRSHPRPIYIPIYNIYTCVGKSGDSDPFYDRHLQRGLAFQMMIDELVCVCVYLFENFQSESFGANTVIIEPAQSLFERSPAMPVRGTRGIRRYSIYGMQKKKKKDRL